MHSSGKQEVADILENYGVRCGKLFTNYDNPTSSNVYNGVNYEQYSAIDINEIFENNAYIFMHEFPLSDILSFNAIKYYE